MRSLLSRFGVVVSMLLAAWSSSLCAAEEADLGRELFVREWRPNDSRSHGGDGLGPMFNDTSCVACHNQGGVGGAGAREKNAEIVSAFRVPAHPGLGVDLFKVFSILFGGSSPAPKAKKPAELTAEERVKLEREQVAKLHPGFATSPSVVLHRFATEDGYESFRQELFTFRSRQADLTFLFSERNTPPLFGSGKIDSIPDEALVLAAQEKFADWPEITGRVSRLKDGRIGRFGWKGQKAKLSEFVLTACAVELGLDVPGEPQAGMPTKTDYKAPGLDLNEDECNALIAFVAKLPAPSEQKMDGKEDEYLAGGRKLFESVGCAACHRPQLGEVTGIYSDLLLHDMGPELSDSGSYGTFVPNATEDEEMKQPLPVLMTQAKPQQPVDESKFVGATRTEWRTPPLWGVRDSAPYLHDGRADTLEQALALHRGEGTRSAIQFIKLTPNERLQLISFLRSLTAPE